MDEKEIRLQAALNELVAQLRVAQDRCLNLAADNAVLRAKVEALTIKPEVKE